jgi:hypothetical protein
MDQMATVPDSRKCTACHSSTQHATGASLAFPVRRNLFRRPVMGSDDQTPMVERQQTRAGQVVAMARRHADEIRASAESEAERVLLEAEREAARHREEWLETDRRERARLAIDKRQIEEALDAVVAAAARVRELIAVLPSEFHQPQAAMEGSDRARRRNGVMNFTAIVLGVWTLVMVATLVVLPGKTANTDTAATVASGETETTVVDTAPAPAARVVVPPPVTPAATRSTAPESDAATRPSDDQGLIVAFVAARDCWISIATDDGTWNERMLRASERHVVRASDAVSFKAGNAGALSVLVNDRPIAPLGAEGRVVTRRITRENYRSFLAS